MLQAKYMNFYTAVKCINIVFEWTGQLHNETEFCALWNICTSGNIDTTMTTGPSKRKCVVNQNPQDFVVEDKRWTKQNKKSELEGLFYSVVDAVHRELCARFGKCNSHLIESHVALAAWTRRPTERTLWISGIDSTRFNQSVCLLWSKMLWHYDAKIHFPQNKKHTCIFSTLAEHALQTKGPPPIGLWEGPYQEIEKWKEEKLMEIPIPKMQTSTLLRMRVQFVLLLQSWFQKSRDAENDLQIIFDLYLNKYITRRLQRYLIYKLIKRIVFCEFTLIMTCIAVTRKVRRTTVSQLFWSQAWKFYPQLCKRCLWWWYVICVCVLISYLTF